MSEIKNGRLDQYGAEPFEQQQFGTAGVKGVNQPHLPILPPPVTAKQRVVIIPGDQPRNGLTAMEDSIQATDLAGCMTEHDGSGVISVTGNGNGNGHKRK